MTAFVVCGGPVWGYPECDALLVDQGRIAAIGRTDELGDRTIRRVDAGGGSILPGFVDAHTHLIETGLAACGFALDLAGRGRDEALDQIGRAARSRGAEWLVATGWDESVWTPSKGIARADLDRVAPSTAVVAVRVDGHVAVLNSVALARAASALADEPRLVDPAAGEVRESAVDRLRALVQPDASTVRDALSAAAATCHGLGITTAHVFLGHGEPQLLFEMASRLRLRLVVHVPETSRETLVSRGARSGDGDAWARWGGVKLFADGSVGARNAAFSSAYLDGGSGALNHDDEDLRRRVAAADRHGWPTLIHAIGDRAIGQVLRAHRDAATDPGLGHRIEHFEFPTGRQIDETRALGLSVCMQPNFVGQWSGTGRLYETALGSRRDEASNPLRAVAEAEIPLQFGSDGMPLGPLYGLSSTVRAPHRGQRLSLAEAVSAYTTDRPRRMRSGANPSAIAVGAPADLVLLDGPLEAGSVAVRRVVRTWIDGESVPASTAGNSA